MTLSQRQQLLLATNVEDLDFSAQLLARRLWYNSYVRSENLHVESHEILRALLRWFALPFFHSTQLFLITF
jgi:hypothetical protein